MLFITKGDTVCGTFRDFKIMTEVFNKKEHTKLRKHLRNSAPDAEKLLWSKLKGSQVLNCKFRRQYGVDKYVVDFYCPELKLGIEIDGDPHFKGNAMEKDKARQDAIEKYGITLLRFYNDDVYKSLNGVLRSIEKHILATKNASNCK